MTLLESQSVVERMATRREPFSDIEALIEAFDLGPDEKSALWLLAWSHQDPRTQRRVAREALAYVGSAILQH